MSENAGATLWVDYNHEELVDLFKKVFPSGTVIRTGDPTPYLHLGPLSHNWGHVTVMNLLKQYAKPPKSPTAK